MMKGLNVVASLVVVLGASGCRREDAPGTTTTTSAAAPVDTTTTTGAVLPAPESAEAGQTPLRQTPGGAPARSRAPAPMGAGNFVLSGSATSSAVANDAGAQVEGSGFGLTTISPATATDAAVRGPAAAAEPAGAEATSTADAAATSPASGTRQGSELVAPGLDNAASGGTSTTSNPAPNWYDRTPPQNRPSGGPMRPGAAGNPDTTSGAR